jgi:hypothetical protein
MGCSNCLIEKKLNYMKTSKKQTKPESKKSNYTKPELKKREQIKEITESPAPISTVPV